tara:strand:+ start:138 stop:545 length:408 start_codon:yes stop_codon:yes gene_type:complete
MVNDLGVDPYEWFDNPLDSMPIAKDEPSIRPVFGGCYNYERLKAEGLVNKDVPTNRYAPPEKLAELESINPRPEEDAADWFNNKKEDDQMKKEETMHHKMYEIATSRYNPFSIGGSEKCDSDISCNIGGSENVKK